MSPPLKLCTCGRGVDAKSSFCSIQCFLHRDSFKPIPPCRIKKVYARRRVYVHQRRKSVFARQSPLS
jgi:hypothetical protein